MIGYWGRASGGRTATHFVNDGAKRPWCGANLHRDAQFYWVAKSNDRVELVECRKCKRTAEIVAMDGRRRA